MSILLMEYLKRQVAPHVPLRFWVRYNLLLCSLRFDRRSFADPFELRWVHPESIQYRGCHGSFRPTANLGSVQGGRWDRPEDPVADHNINRGIEQRFLEGRDWQDTDYYAYNARLISDGARKKGCSTVEEFLEVRCGYVDALYESIAADGYRTQAELDGAMIDMNKLRGRRHLLEVNEVGVNVGRDGRLFINTGNHRLAIAKVLGLERIPVSVIVRHPGWQRLREEIACAESVASLSPAAQAAMSHPDTVDVAGEWHEGPATSRDDAATPVASLVVPSSIYCQD